MPPKLKFSEGERVLCFHGPLIYEAKCIKGQVKEKTPRYLIHYNGWNKNWDEWVPENRVLKFNEANLMKQKELREQIKNKKARKKQDKTGVTNEPEKIPKREDTPSSGPTRRKRARLNADNDENYVSRVDVKIMIPEDLKQWLVDDWDLITRQKQLVPLPRKNTIADILDDYAKHRVKNPNGIKPGVAQEVVDGIQEYFNVMLGTQLLYKFERPQYGDLLLKNPNLPMSQIYGSEHLLRLFVKLSNALSYSNLEDKSIQFVVSHIHDCLDYLATNADSLFSTDYETTTPEYHRRAAS